MTVLEKLYFSILIKKLFKIYYDMIGVHKLSMYAKS